jgi:4-hydroxybenzoate polyprenyltransferase
VGAFWIGFILGGYSVMTLIAILKVGAPPWIFLSVLITWAIVVVGISEHKRKQAKVIERQQRGE